MKDVLKKRIAMYGTMNERNYKYVCDTGGWDCVWLEMSEEKDLYQSIDCLVDLISIQMPRLFLIPIVFLAAVHAIGIHPTQHQRFNHLTRDGYRLETGLLHHTLIKGQDIHFLDVRLFIK